jgi:uncharacterized membrane protein
LVTLKSARHLVLPWQATANGESSHDEISCPGIGAGSGALIGALTPLGILPGALVGGAVGAGVGAATTPQR